MIRLFIAAISLTILAGCAERTMTERGDGLYALTFWDPVVQHGFAGQELELDAIKLCPNGFTVVEDNVIPHQSGKPAYEWVVRCHDG